MAERSFLEKDFPNIWDYLYAYGNTSFQELRFNDADNLVLACLSYIPWENFEKTNDSFSPLSLKQAAEDFLYWLRPDFLLYHYPDWSKKQILVAAALLKSSRFSSLRWTSFGFELSDTDKTQFGAFCIELDKNTVAVCYRGTDNSILGWKESRNLAIYPSVPGQVASAKFLKEQRKRYSDKKFIVLGHSKGGNLAVYAASMLTEKDSERVLTVYSDDGPGLAKEIYDLPGHLRIQGKIIHIVPQCDVVGSLLLHEQVTKIVLSSPKNDFINQHDLANWHLKKDCLYELDTVDELDQTALLLANSVNELLETKLQDKKEKEKLVSGLFSTVNDIGITEAGQIIANPSRFRRKFVLEFPKQDKKEKKVRMSAAFDLARIIQKNWSKNRSKNKKKGKDSPLILSKERSNA